MKAKLFDSAIVSTPQEALDFIGNILESSTEYSIIGEDLDGRILLWNEGAHGLYGYESEEVLGIANSSMLHTPKDVKVGKPSDQEWEHMRQHPVFAFEMLSPITYLKSSLDIPYCHHEKWDGTGYPRGLKGEVIPLAARLFAVVDEWDALRSDRPYRKAWTRERTLEHIKSLSGTHFDPKVVEYFLELIK